MSKNKRFRFLGKDYIIKYKSIAWYISNILEFLFYLLVSIFLIFDIWALVSIIIILL